VTHILTTQQRFIAHIIMKQKKLETAWTELTGTENVCLKGLQNGFDFLVRH